MTVPRLLFTRRWLGLTLLALLMAGAFAGLGRWQLERSYRSSDGYSSEPVAVPLTLLVPAGTTLPSGAVGRQVTASGKYLAAGQQLVAGHTLGGGAVVWVVTPLSLADGSTVEVVRGWVSRSEATLDAPPLGTVQVTGRLQTGSPTPAGTIAGSMRSAYLVRTAQTPPDPLSLQPVPSQPPHTTGGTMEFHLQNALYTSQWWIFAVLVVVYWWRLLRDERSLSSEAP